MPVNEPEPIAIENTSTTTLSIEREIDSTEQTESCSENTVFSITHNTSSKEMSLSQNLAEVKPMHSSLPACSSEKNKTIVPNSQILHKECNEIHKDLSNISHLELSKEEQTVEVKSLKTVVFTVNQAASLKPVENLTDNYEYLNRRLERLAIPELTEPISEARELELSDPSAFLKPSQIVVESLPYEQEIESAIPSAPIFEAEIQPQVHYQQEQIQQETMPKLQCMPLEEAVNMFGGREMIAVKMMSEKEEAIVEAGPISGPEHPLVDLLSTFK